MPRFFCPPPISASGSFDLPPDAAHHAHRVLRLKVADRVEIFDGAGNAYHGQITVSTGRQVTVSDLAPTGSACESPLHTVLAQSLLNSDKMDWVIQKSTELGITEIQPLATERSVARLAADRTAKRLEHWQQVAVSACEQCGRNVLPRIHPPLDIMEWLQQCRSTPDTKFILLPDGATTAHDHAQPQGRVVLMIGAEGGFSQLESTTALSSGFIPLRLGNRVMRTETAAVAGIAVLQMLWGDF